MFSRSFLSMYISSSWRRQEENTKIKSGVCVCVHGCLYDGVTHLPVTDCQLLQEVSEDQRRVFNQAVPQDLLGDGAD